MADKQLLVEEVRGNVTGLSGLLTCGHYAGPFHEASSVWGQPDQAHRCASGCGYRQFDLRLQVVLMEGNRQLAGPYDWSTDDDWGVK